MYHRKALYNKKNNTLFQVIIQVRISGTGTESQPKNSGFLLPPHSHKWNTNALRIDSVRSSSIKIFAKGKVIQTSYK